nr:GFA family protein [Amylibacter sp.]
MPQATTGHCFCGRVTFAFTGPQTWACHCHCADCRRNCAAPVVSFLGTPLNGFEWTGQSPKQFNSSKGVTRHFCDTCGTPMAFQADHYAGEIHLYAATLTHPQDFTPAFHVHYNSRLTWLHLDDDLPKHAGSAP